MHIVNQCVPGCPNAGWYHMDYSQVVGDMINRGSGSKAWLGVCGTYSRVLDTFEVSRP